MIKVTDVSGKEKYLNCDLIEKIELIPDTLIGLVNGRNFIVKETPEELIEKVAEFKRRCHEPAICRKEMLEEFMPSELAEELKENEEKAKE